MTKSKLTLIAALLIMTAGLCPAATYYVATAGSDANDGLTELTAFATIQHGIDSSAAGDTVLVTEGVYNESINFNGKAITVRSASGVPYNTSIITPVAVSLYSVRLTSAEGPDSILQGFTVTGYIPVRCDNSSPVISNCIITGGYTENIYLKDSSAEIRNCIITGSSYGVKTVGTGRDILRNNTIAANSSCGVSIADGGVPPSITNCIIWGNSAG